MDFARLLTGFWVKEQTSIQYCQLLWEFIRPDFGKHLGKLQCPHLKISLKQDLILHFCHTSKEEQPLIMLFITLAVKIFHRVVMDQQRVPRTRMFLKMKLYSRKTWRRKHFRTTYTKWHFKMEHSLEDTVESLKKKGERVNWRHERLRFLWAIKEGAWGIKVHFKNSFLKRDVRMAWNLQFEVIKRNRSKRKKDIYLQKIVLNIYLPFFL